MTYNYFTLKMGPLGMIYGIRLKHQDYQMQREEENREEQGLSSHFTTLHSGCKY